MAACALSKGMGHALLEADDELDDDEFQARQQRLREREAALDAREALLVALEVEAAERRRQAERRSVVGEAIEAQPRIAGAAVENSEDSQGRVEPGFDSSEVTRLDYVANNLLQTHGKDAVIKIINGLRETFPSHITLTDLQGIGGEDLVKILVQIAAGNYVEAAALSEMIARGTRECEE